MRIGNSYIDIPVDEKLANQFSSLAEPEKERYRAMMRLYIRKLLTPLSLNKSMDALSDEAEANHLTSKTLDSILKEQ